MIDDVKRLGDFRAILCWDQDRFGRFDSIEAGEWISPLRRAGVELICVVQGRINWDDFAGRMIYQITQEGKNQFLVSLSNNVMRGMLKQARDGYGKRRSPYGYDRVYFDEAGNEMHRVVGSARFAKPKGWKAKLAPPEAEQEVETIKWIFDTYANTDANSRSIASDLNRRGIKTRSGIDWQCQSVRVVLRNPVYIGTMRVSSGAGQSEHCYSIRKDQLEPLVIGKIVGLLDTPNIKGQIETAIARRLKASATKTHDTKSLRQLIAELEKNIAKGVERLMLLDGENLEDASRMLADWRTQRRSLEEQLQASARNPSASPDHEAARVAPELSGLRETFALADPAALRAALASVIQDVTLYWTDGGPRKWRFQRGTIRLGGSLRLLARSTKATFCATPIDLANPFPSSPSPQGFFVMRKQQRCDRRTFIAATGAAASSMMLGNRRAWSEQERPLKLAIIGVANRGSSNFSAVASQTIQALCDIDHNYLQKAAEKYPKAAVYTDYRELLETESDLDGVVISTPDHHHAPAAIRAIDRGLHVYCEKPLTHTVSEARALAVAAKEKGVVTQMGTQIHAGENYRRVVELISAKAIGDVKRVHVWVGKGWGADSMPQPSGDPPASLCWDEWLGPAAERDYIPGLHPANWRRYRDFGAGTLGDMGCHYMDLPFWALQLRYPTTVVADGPESSPEFCPQGLKVSYRFAASDHHDDLELVWYDGNMSPRELEGVKVPGSGVLFVGDKGMMIATYGDYQLLPAERFIDFNPPARSIAPSIGHHAEWLQAIRHGGQPLCHFGYSGPLTETVLLGTVAHQVGRSLRWDGQSMKFREDDKANELLTKSYRTGWEVRGAMATEVVS